MLIGIRRVPFAIWLAPRAVEDLIRADVQQGRAGPLGSQGHVLRAERIHPVRQLRVLLGAVHVGVGRGMDDQVRRKPHDALHDAGVGDVVAGQVERQQLVRRKGREKLAAELTVVSGDDNTHARSFLSDSCRRLQRPRRNRASVTGASAAMSCAQRSRLRMFAVVSAAMAARPVNGTKRTSPSRLALQARRPRPSRCTTTPGPSGPAPSGITRRPPGASCCTRAGGTSAGAAVTMIAS